MKYKKGSKVEVLKEKVFLGSWRCAEVLSGNGHYYTVRYDAFSGSSDMYNVERVPRRRMRPCPPHVVFYKDWIPGDVVEVFHDDSWKVAALSEVLDESSCVIRLIGSSQEYAVSRSELRVRQLWHNDEWIVLEKVLRTFDDNNKQKKCPNLRSNQRLGYQTDTENKIYSHEPQLCSSIIRKRGSSCFYSQLEGHEESAKKRRRNDKEGEHRVFAAKQISIFEKVVFASNRKMLSEKFMHPSFKNQTIGFSEMDMLREKRNSGVGCSTSTSDLHNSNDVSSSVGSCSITSNSPYKLQCSLYTGGDEDYEDQCSDAESFCRVGDGEGNHRLPSKEELAAEIHRAEVGGFYFWLLNLMVMLGFATYLMV